VNSQNNNNLLIQRSVIKYNEVHMLPCCFCPVKLYW